MKTAFILLSALLLSGCTVAKTQSMGAGQFMVTCRDSAMFCAQQANATCTRGYDVIGLSGTVDDFGRMTMIVRCL